MSQHTRARLAALAKDVTQWHDAMSRIDPDCTCRLSTKPGFHPVDNPGCTSGRHCRGMTVLTVRTHMGVLRVNTRHLAASDIPRLVDDLHALMAELPDTRDGLAFAQRLQQIVTTGHDPHRPTQPTPAEGAAPA